VWVGRLLAVHWLQAAGLGLGLEDMPRPLPCPLPCPQHWLRLDEASEPATPRGEPAGASADAGGDAAARSGAEATLRGAEDRTTSEGGGPEGVGDATPPPPPLRSRL